MTPTPAHSAPESRRTALAEARLAAYLPMVYVAWADGDLEPEEIAGIRARMAAELPASCRDPLGSWLDPGAPPAAGELAVLLANIRRAGRELPEVARRSLTVLGEELALRRGTTLHPREREALSAIETALGLDGAEAAHGLVAEAPRQPEVIPPPAPFDVAALAAFLDGEQRATRERLRRLLASPEFAYLSEPDRETYRAQVLSWCHRLAEEGIGSLGLPREHGGAGDPAAFLAAFETIAHHDLSLLVKYGVQFGLFAGGIHQLGTERHHTAWLPAAGRLDLPGSFAMTETGHGSNVADLETTACYDPADGTFDIHTPHPGARKDYIGNAARDARLAVVFAQLETGGARQGVHAFIVPIREETGRILPGIHIEDCGPKLGLNGVDNGRIGFDHVRVPREALLDRFAAVAPDGTYSSPIASPGRRFFTTLGTLVGGRVSVALASVATAKSALCIAVRYAERRRQFGAPGGAETVLLDYPSHQRRLLPRLAQTYALHFALRELGARYVEMQTNGEGHRDVEGLAAGLKAVATWHATDTIQACREACGGQGYLSENRFAALKGDSDVFTTFEGDNTVLLQLVAKGLLSEYKKQFGDMHFLDLMRYVASQAGTAVRELNPIITRRTDPEHLRDPEFHLSAMRWREEHLLASVARRLRRRLGDGMEPTQAMLECQTHLLALARSHVDRVVVERANAAVAAITDVPGELGTVLRPLLALHALARLEADAGWLLEHGVLEAAKARAIRTQVDALCLELRPAALGLVDAFAIPDELLAAPIAID
jgi:acyl-CoA oxidase